MSRIVIKSRDSTGRTDTIVATSYGRINFVGGAVEVEAEVLLDLSTATLVHQFFSSGGPFDLTIHEELASGVRSLDGRFTIVEINHIHEKNALSELAIKLLARSGEWHRSY